MGDQNQCTFKPTDSRNKKVKLMLPSFKDNTSKIPTDKKEIAETLTKYYEKLYKKMLTTQIRQEWKIKTSFIIQKC